MAIPSLAWHPAKEKLLPGALPKNPPAAMKRTLSIWAEAMKIITVTVTLDGTPGELAEYNRHMGEQVPKELAMTSASTEHFEANEEAGEIRKYVSIDVARRFLNRRPLAKEQREVLSALYKAHPNRVSGAELQKIVGYSARQLAGLMGAFGRRLAHTPGRHNDEHFFDWKWIDGEWFYGLPDTVRRALEIEKMA